jgi:hypothetical protein
MPTAHSWVISACGLIADYQARDLRMRDSQILQLVLGGKGDSFEVDDARTGRVAVRVSRIPAVQPGGDLNGLACEFAVRTPADYATQGLIGFWRECELFAALLRPAIDALSGAVMVRGALSYQEAAGIARAAMAGKPVPEWPEDWAR